MEVAPGIHRLGSRFVNFYLVTDDSRRGVTVVDAGLPAQWSQLESALARLGRSMSDVEALLLTHSHADHVGFAERARQQSPVRVLVHGADRGDGVRSFPPPFLFLLPTSWPLLVHTTRGGMARTPPVQVDAVFRDGATLDVPGRPVAAHTPGHTPGSCVFHFPERDALLTGDALVTFDPYLGRQGPRRMLKPVNHDHAAAYTSLERIAGLRASTVLPGHGEPWTQGTAAAVKLARRAF